MKLFNGFLTILFVAPNLIAEQVFNSRCDYTDSRQKISVDGKAEPVVAKKQRVLGAQTLTENADSQTIKYEFATYTDNQSSDGHCTILTEKHQKLISEGLSEEISVSEADCFSGDNKPYPHRHFELTERLQTQSDGTQKVVLKTLNGVDESMDNQTDIRFTAVDGTRIKVFTIDKPYDINQKDGSIIKVLMARRVCVVTPK